MLAVANKYNMGICLSHSVGVPKTMNNNPHYENVVLDVYDYLEDSLVLLLTSFLEESVSTET